MATSAVQKILLFGPAGAGKDTQADLLMLRFGLKKLSLGEILREEAASASDLGKEIAPYLARGEMVPKGIGTQLMRAKILDEQVQQSGYAISSFPRTLESFQNYLTFDQPTLLIVIKVPDHIAIERLVSRKRHDDYENAIRKRLSLYHELDEVTIEWVKQNTRIPVFEVDGTLPIERVNKEITMVIESA